MARVKTNTQPTIANMLTLVLRQRDNLLKQVEKYRQQREKDREKLKTLASVQAENKALRAELEKAKQQIASVEAKLTAQPVAPKPKKARAPRKPKAQPAPTPEVHIVDVVLPEPTPEELEEEY
jgi:hypothetical protein